MKIIKYLYTKGWRNGLTRYRVTRETEKTYWVYVNSHYEAKISKKKMQTGSGYECTHYYEETEQLKSEYSHIVKYSKYRKKLNALIGCDDEKIMDKILSIEINEA